MKGLRIGLLDWGQVKHVDSATQSQLAHLMHAFQRDEPAEIRDAFLGLGVRVSQPEDVTSVRQLALSMFESRNVEGMVFSPFSPDNALASNQVTEFPSELFFVLRSVQMLRGLAHGMGVNFSVAEAWDKHTSRYLPAVEQRAPALRTRKARVPVGCRSAR